MRTLLLLAILTFLTSSQMKSEINHRYEILVEALKEFESNQEPLVYADVVSSDSLVHALLLRIKETQTETIYDMSQDILMITKKIELRTDSLITALEDAHGVDNNGDLIDKRNTQHLYSILIEKGQGEKLFEMLRSSSRILSIAAQSLGLDHESVVHISVGKQDVPENTTWWMYNFEDKPAQTVIPILRKFNNDARTTKVEFLNQIAEMKR